MLNPLLSIIVPVYNVQDYLEKCLDSIILQKYDNFEVWLVDDGSTDNTGMICDYYAQKDKRIKVIHQSNRGVSSARNAALERINGYYVTFVDGDDWIEPHIYLNCIEKMSKYNANMVAFDVVNYFSGGQKKKCSIYKGYEDVLYKNQNELISVVFQNSAWIWNKVFSRDIIQGLCFDERMSYGEDVYFLLQILKNKPVKCYVTNDTGYYRLIRRESATGGGVSKKNIEYIKNNLKMYSELNEMGLPCVGMLRVYVSVFTLIEKMIGSNCDDNRYIRYGQRAIRHPGVKNLRHFIRDSYYSKKTRLIYIIMYCSLRFFLYLKKFERKLGRDG